VTAALLVVVAARIGVAPAERCPRVGPEDARAAIAAGVGWLADGQQRDGRYTYLQTEDGEDLGGYSVVRHGGVQLALEQAAADGDDTADATAARGRAWAIDHLVAAGGGRALPELDGDARTGASALFALSLLERRAATASREHDAVLVDLGRFLASQVDATGSVSAVWDRSTDAPVPDTHDKFFTGQVLWALNGLADVGLADDRELDALRRVGDYLPLRDELEDFEPPVSDHWGAYAYDSLGLDRMTSVQVAHAKRVADLIGLQVRGESTRWRGGLISVIRGGHASGSGVGTLGEGGAALLRLFGEDELPGMAERLRCNSGMLVERQADDGAWYRDGVTRMDDQQHSISALLAALPVLSAEADAVGGGAEDHSLLWLLVAAFVVANPFRPGRARGGTFGAVVGAGLLVVLSGPVLDGLDVSPASARAAAGAALGLAALAGLAAPGAAATGGIVTAAAGLVALALGADDGAPALFFVLVAALLAVAVPQRWRNGVTTRVAAAVALLLAADLLVDGIMGI
jgi:hypothetical protein